MSGRNSVSEPAPASRQAVRTGFDADPRQRLVLQASPQSALESLFSRENPETRPHRIAVEGFISSPLVPRYLTSWDVAARKSSAASEIDNRADTILDSGGPTTNKPNCAAQLANRNYVHQWTSSIHSHRCV